MRGIVVIVAALLAGCAPKLSPQGALVREVRDVEIRSTCEFLGVVEEEASTTAMGDALTQAVEDINAGQEGRYARNTGRTESTEALTKVRNTVAEMGGDAFIIVGAGDYDVQAEAYRCVDESSPVVPTEIAD